MTSGAGERGTDGAMGTAELMVTVQPGSEVITAELTSVNEPDARVKVAPDTQIKDSDRETESEDAATERALPESIVISEVIEPD